MMRRNGARAVFGSYILFAAVCVATFCTTQLFNTTNPQLRGLRLQEETTAEQGTNTTLQQEQEAAGGWSNIQVFYGNKEPLERTLGNQSWFSQVQQDQIVAALLRNKTNGYFVDLAANDAVELSNTLALERSFGWKGLCIEPNPSYWPKLAYRDCQVVAAVVGKERNKEVQFNFKGVYGGIVDKAFDNNEDKHRQQATPMHTVPLLEVFQKNRVPTEIDYLSLDVEGAESYIMLNFPIDQYTVKVLTVERPKDDLVQFLNDHGYQQLVQITYWRETLWAHTSAMEDLDLTALDRFFPSRKKKES